MSKLSPEQNVGLSEIHELFKREDSAFYKKEIAGLMVKHKLFLPVIITQAISGKNPDDADLGKTIKGICEVTGYSFEELGINKNFIEILRKKYTNICKGCDDKKQKWQYLFGKISKEYAQYKQVVA